MTPLLWLLALAGPCSWAVVLLSRSNCLRVAARLIARAEALRLQGEAVRVAREAFRAAEQRRKAVVLEQEQLLGVARVVPIRGRVDGHLGAARE